MAHDLIDRIPELERAAREFERKAAALRKIIDGVRELNGEAARFFGGGETGSATETPPTAVPRGRNQWSDGVPRGRAAVLAVVAERPGVWRSADIKREIKLRGWPSSPAAIDNAVKRLVSDGEAERLDNGIYRFGADAPNEAVTRERGGANESLTLDAEIAA